MKMSNYSKTVYMIFILVSTQILHPKVLLRAEYQNCMTDLRMISKLSPKMTKKGTRGAGSVCQIQSYANFGSFLAQMTLKSVLSAKNPMVLINQPTPLRNRLQMRVATPMLPLSAPLILDRQISVKAFLTLPHLPTI